MSDRQAAKKIVLEYFAAMESANTDALGNVISEFVAPKYRFRGVHPFNEIDSATNVASQVWQPLRESFTPMQRRQDIFMAGPDLNDDRMWVTSMGTFLGLFDGDWLGIPSTGKIVMIPYCEFHHVKDDALSTLR